METIALLVMGVVNIACFIIGAKVGQQTAKGEPVKVELPNPVAAVREYKQYREDAKERSQVEAILRNIDRYDGNPGGQEEIPV
jgi:hypothetical protein